MIILLQLLTLFSLFVDRPMYDSAMQTAFDPGAFRRSVLAYIREHELLRPGDRAGVAVSGGADSVALLRVMVELRAELGLVLSVAHFNHKIRGEASDGDERFVRHLAEVHGLEFHLSGGDVPAHAKSHKLSLETAARDLRYRYFSELIASGAVSKVMTAHTLDDQAETVLMRILRGTGTAGLAGVYPRVKVGNGEIIRPLLGVRRCEIESYLRKLDQPWQEDATNQDVHHARNRVRHVLLPLMESEFNPAVRQRLSELADIARVEEEHWATILKAAELDNGEGTLDADSFQQFPPAIQRRVLRRIGDQLSVELDFEMIEAIRRFATADTRVLELTAGWNVIREIERRPNGGRGRTLLRFEKGSERPVAGDYEYSVEWPGEVAIPELGATVCLRLCGRQSGGEKRSDGPPALYNSMQLLDSRKLLPQITLRNWRAGDQFWPAHTSGPKKVKELLQRQHVTGAARQSWPVAESGGEIVWMRGFPVSEKHRIQENAESALLIEEVRPAVTD